MPFEPVVKPAAAGIGESADTVGLDRESAESFTNGSQNLVGRVLGGTYRILESLDEGGMGRLYRAEHVRLRRPIAVKVLANHLAHDAGALARFNREAEIVSQLHHPHIVHILDFDQTDEGAPYIVMELLQGESLARKLDRDRMLPIAEAVQIVAQIAGALQLAHQKGIVHRDLKPDNVFLIAIEDGQIFVKLLDFGISKSTSAAAKVTREFDVLGTPDYMAPEQAISTAKADHRADQFALASMTYEMLTGRMPFVAESVAELLHKVVHENPVSLSYYAPGLPAGIDTVVMRAMAKLPDARFPGIQDFAMALAQAAGVALHANPGVSNSTTPEPPPVMASLPNYNAGPARRTPSGDLSTIARQFEQSLQVPEVPRTAPRRFSTPDGITQTIPAPQHRSSGAGAGRGSGAGAGRGAGASNSGLRGTASDTVLDRVTEPSAEPPPPREPSGSPSDSGSGSRVPHRPVLRSNGPPDTNPAAGAAPQRHSIRPAEPAPATMRSHSPSSPAAGEVHRSYPPGKRPVGDLELAVADVRRAVSFGEQQRASVQARRVVHLARDCDERQARHCLSEATSLLEPLLMPQVGGSHRKVTLLNSRVSSQGDWTPGHFFLLSRIEQPATVEELLDISPLTRPETLCFIADLSGQGIVRID